MNVKRVQMYFGGLKGKIRQKIVLSKILSVI